MSGKYNPFLGAANPQALRNVLNLGNPPSSGPSLPGPAVTGMSNPPPNGGNANIFNPAIREANLPMAANSQANQGNRNPISTERKSQHKIEKRETAVEDQNQQRQEIFHFQDRIPSRSPAEQQAGVVREVQPPPQEQKKPLRQSILIQVRNPFSLKTIESSHHFIQGIQPLPNRPFTEIEREDFQRQLLVLVKNKEITSHILKRLDLLTSCQELSERRGINLSLGEMNRLGLGFQFYAEKIPTAVTLKQQKAFYQCFVLNKICKNSVDLIKTTYNLSSVCAYYVFSHAFCRIIKIPIHKLYSLNDDFKLAEIVEEKYLLSVYFKTQCQKFMVRQKKFYTDFVKHRLQHERLHSPVWRQKGIEKIITEMIEIQHFQPHHLQSKEITPNNSILMLNSTITQIVDIIHLYNQLSSQTENTINKPIPLEKVKDFLLKIQQKFCIYKEFLNVQVLLNCIAEIKVPQVLRNLLQRKLVGNNRKREEGKDIDIGGAWGVLINFMFQQKFQNYPSINGKEPDHNQAQRELFKVFDSIQKISHIEAIKEWLEIIERKVNSFCKSLKQTKAQSASLRQQTIQFFILFQFLTRLKQPQNSKSKQQIQIPSTLSLLNQPHKQIQNRINIMLNDLLLKLIIFRFTISIVVVPLVYARFHDQRKESLSNQVNVDKSKYQLVIQEDSICTLLNTIVCKENKSMNFKKLQDIFKKKLFPTRLSNYQISQDFLYAKCIKPYVKNDSQVAVHVELLEVESLFLRALNILLQNIITQTQESSFRPKEKLERIKGVLKKLGLERVSLLQDVREEFFEQKSKRSTIIPAVNNTDANEHQDKVKQSAKNLRDEQFEVLEKFCNRFIRRVINMLSRRGIFENQPVTQFKNFSKIIQFFRTIYQLFSQTQIRDEKKKITAEQQDESQEQKNEIILYNLSLLDQMLKCYKENDIEDQLTQLREKVSAETQQFMVQKAHIYLELLQQITSNNSTSSQQLMRDKVVMLQAVHFLKQLYKQESSTEDNFFNSLQQDSPEKQVSFINFLRLALEHYILPFLRYSKDEKNPRLQLLIKFLRIIEKNIVRRPKLITLIVNEIIGQQNERQMEIERPHIQRAQSPSLCRVAVFNLLNPLISYTKQIKNFKQRLANIQRIIPDFPNEIIISITSQLLKREIITESYNTSPIGKLLHDMLHQSFDENINVKNWPMLISSIPYQQKTMVQKYVKLSLCNKLMKEFSKRQQNGMTYTFKPSEYNFVPVLNQSNFFHFLKLIRQQLTHPKRNLEDSPIRALHQNSEDEESYLNPQLNQSMRKQLQKNVVRLQVNYCQLYENIIKGIWKDAITEEVRKDKCSEKMDFCLGVINEFFLDAFFWASDKEKLYICTKIGLGTICQLQILKKLRQVNSSPQYLNISTIPNQINFFYMKQFTNSKSISQPNIHMQQIHLLFNKQRQHLDQLSQSFITLITNAIDKSEFLNDQLEENVIKMLPLIDKMGNKIKWDSRNKILNVLAKSEFSLQRIMEIADANSVFGRMVKLLMLQQTKKSHAQFIRFDNLSLASYLVKSLFNILSDKAYTMKEFLVSIIPMQSSSTKLSHPCQTISTLLTLSIKVIQNLYVLNSASTLQSEISKLLMNLVNIVEVVYEPLIEVVSFKQHEVVDKNGIKMYEHLIQQIQRLKGMFEKLTRNQEISILNIQSLKQTSVYLAMVISQATKQVNQRQSSFQQSTLTNNLPLASTIANNPQQGQPQGSQQRGRKLIIYLGQSIVIPNLKCCTRQQFKHYLNLYISALSNLPLMKILQSYQHPQSSFRITCIIHNYNPFINYMNSFIQFLELNSQYNISHDELFFFTESQELTSPSYQLINKQFQKLFRALEIWNVYTGMYPEIVGKLTGHNNTGTGRNQLNANEIINAETIMLACLKIMTLTCKLFTIIIDKVNLNLPSIYNAQQPHKHYYIRQGHTVYFCHMLILRILTSPLFISFKSHLIQTQYDAKAIKILRSFQSKIILSHVFNLLQTIIGKRFLSRTELQQPLQKLSYAGCVFSQRKNDCHEMSLINVIELQLIQTFLQSFVNDNTDAHLDKEIDTKFVQSGIDQYRAKMKRSIKESVSQQGDDMPITYFSYFDKLNTLILMRSFTKFLSTTFSIIQNKKPLRMLIKQKNQTISYSLKLIKFYFDTYFVSKRPSQKQMRERRQIELRKEQQDRLTALEILKEFEHGFTRMKIQLHTLLFSQNTHPTTQFLRSICSQIVNRVVNCGIYHLQQSTYHCLSISSFRNHVQMKLEEEVKCNETAQTQYDKAIVELVFRKK